MSVVGDGASRGCLRCKFHARIVLHAVSQGCSDQCWNGDAESTSLNFKRDKPAAGTLALCADGQLDLERASASARSLATGQATHICEMRGP